jgi:integrase
MTASGADIAVVSKLMRHASIAITADVYSLWSVPSLRKPWRVPRT